MLRVILYAGYKFNDRVVFNSELEFEHATTGAGDDEKGEVSVEFAYLDETLNPGPGASSPSCTSRPSSWARSGPTSSA